MTDDEFLRYVPRCAECGEILPPSGAYDAIAALYAAGRSYTFHAGCAPEGCKPGHVVKMGPAYSAPARWNNPMPKE